MIQHHKLHGSWLAALCLALVAFTGGALAAGTVHLDLDAAIRLGLENDPAVRLAEVDLKLAAVGLEQAEAGHLIQPSPTLLYQARVGVDLAARSLTLARRQAALQMEEDYYNVLRLESLLAVLDEAIRLSERQLAVAESRQRSGAATALDVIRAEAALARNRMDRDQLTDNLQLAANKLLRTLGLAPGTPLVLDDALVTQSLPQIDLASAFEESRQSRVELAQASAGVGIAETELELVTNDYTPPLTRRQAEIELERARYRLQQAEMGIALDVENAFHQMHQAARRLEVSALELLEAGENHRVVNALFDAGMATDVEILQVQTGLTQARGARVEAVYDFNVARAKFFNALGRDLGQRHEE